MATERTGYELVRAVWHTMRALEGVAPSVSGAFVLAMSDRLIAGDEIEAIADDIKKGMPMHLLQSPADKLVARARARARGEEVGSDIADRFIADRDKRAAAAPNPLTPPWK